MYTASFNRYNHDVCCCVSQGALIIDPTAASLELQAHYILLRGGMLRAGQSIDQPHPGRFVITLWGDKETSRRLPTSGAKVGAG